MKLTVQSEELDTVTRSYPYIGVGKTSGSKVLFSAPGIGTIIDGGNTIYDLGYYSPSWAEDNFDIFIGSVTITVEK